METETAAAVAILPDDALADVLRRLPVRSLAASRRVCKAWRAVVDEQELLLRLRRLLPNSVRGIFINYMDHRRPYFLARPAPASRSSGWPLIDGELGSVVCGRWHKVRDHCNGLVLFLDGDKSLHYVCNPATRRWTLLPPRPSGMNSWNSRAFLVFDPAASPDYYEVLLEPLDPLTERNIGGDKDDTMLLMEWPPPSWTWHGFSSATGRWEEKVFVRENEAAGTVASLNTVCSIYGIAEDRWRYAAYWKGALHVQCRGEYVTRLSLSNNKYQVIKSPIDLVECKTGVRSFLGRSGKGVYFAAIDGTDQLRVWILSEAHDLQMEWVLKHRSSMKTRTWWLHDEKYRKLQYKGPWILNVRRATTKAEDKETLVHKDASWSFDDDDNVIDVVDDDEEELDTCVRFLGFHPYKEIIFLCSMGYIAVAYHLNSAKVQYLGELGLGYGTYHRGVHESFVYTPCMTRN